MNERRDIRSRERRGTVSASLRDFRPKGKDKMTLEGRLGKRTRVKALGLKKGKSVLGGVTYSRRQKKEGSLRLKGEK